MDKKKFAVIISGCGVFDGAEIHEATLTLYAIMKNNAEYEIFAPDMDQYHIIDHLTGEEMEGKRNVLVEAARLARGNIKPLSQCKMDAFDGVIMPGGFGAAKNLSTFAFSGANCNVIPELEKVLKDSYSQNKPIGALCISPVILARVFHDVKVTIGENQATAEAIEKMGGQHQKTTHGEVVIDEKYKLVSTPCYMLNANIVQIADGANNVVKAMIKIRT